MIFPPTSIAEKCRMAGPFGDCYGAFQIKLGAFRLRAIVSCGMGWDHVSVSLPNRCPTWEEMDTVKRIFFADSEIVMQLHVNDPSHKVNMHQFCLHLWRPQTAEEHNAHNQRMLASGEKCPPSWFQTPTPAAIPMPPEIIV